MKIEINGYAAVSTEVETLGDLREFIAQLDKWRVRDDSPIDWGYNGKLFVDVADTQRGDRMEPIMCGDHIPLKGPDGKYIDHSDFVITAHNCTEREPIDYSKPVDYNGPETYEEALEEALDAERKAREEVTAEYDAGRSLREEFAAYDWPSIDRARRQQQIWEAVNDRIAEQAVAEWIRTDD